MKPSASSWALPLALALSALVPASEADDALPKARPAAEYEPMAARSPFMAPTAPPPTATPSPVPAGPHWWDQMFVTSLMEAGGVYYAAVVDHANNKRYVLESGKLDEDSRLLLADVQWNERADQSTITVRKGPEVAPPLRFDASAVASTPTIPPQPFGPNNPPHYQPGIPNPPMPAGFTPPPPPPATSVVRRSGPIGARPPVPGNTGAVVPPAPPVTRRTIRPLNGNDEPGN